MQIRILLFTALLALAACAPKSYVVLLEDEDGTTGALTVSDQRGDRRVDTAGTAVALEDPERARRSPWQATLESIQEVFGAAFALRPPPHATYVLYFEFGSAELTAASTSTLETLREDIRSRPAPDARVDGHADRFDSDKTNDGLSLLRALVVEDLLEAAGIAPERIRIDAHGETRPAVNTADGVREPRNRRVVVTLR